MVYDLVLQIQRKAIVCVPILKYIEETIRVFRKPVKMWQEGSRELKAMAGEAKYMTVFNEFIEGIDLDNRPQNGFYIFLFILKSLFTLLTCLLSYI